MACSAQQRRNICVRLGVAHRRYAARRARAINASPPTSSTSITIVLSRLVGAEVDVEVRNHARQDKQSSRHREQPAERAATIPGEHRRADKHRQQRDSKSVRAFARDPAIVKAARGITDLVLLDLALHSFDGGDRACSGRSYLPT